MPMDAGAIGIRPVTQQRPTGGVDGVQRRDDGSSQGGGFRPQTNVALKTAIEDLSNALSKISAQEKFGIGKMPQEVGEIVKNILQQSFSMEETLTQGIGSTIESQRFSMEQLTVFSRMLLQIGALADKGFSMQLSDETQLILSKFKDLLVAQEGGNSLEPVLLSKAAFELIDSKTAEQLPQAVYEILSQLAAQTPTLQTNQPQQSEGMQFLKQLIQYFMPRPSTETVAKENLQGQQPQEKNSSQQQNQNPNQAQQAKSNVSPQWQQAMRQSATQQFLQSMFKQLTGNKAPNQQGVQNQQNNFQNQQGVQTQQNNFQNQQRVQNQRNNFQNQQRVQNQGNNFQNQQGVQTQQNNSQSQQNVQPQQNNFQNQQGVQTQQNNFQNQQGVQTQQNNFQNQQGVQTQQNNFQNQQNVQTQQNNLQNQQGVQTQQNNLQNQQGVQPQQNNFQNQQGVQTQQNNFQNQQGVQTQQNNLQNQQGVQTQQNNLQNQQGVQTQQNNFQNQQGVQNQQNNFQNQQSVQNQQNNLQNQQGVQTQQNNLQNQQGVQTQQNNLQNQQGVQNQQNNFQNQQGVQTQQNNFQNQQGVQPQQNNFQNQQNVQPQQNNLSENRTEKNPNQRLQNFDEDFLNQQQEIKEQMAMAKSLMLKQPIQNDAQTMDAMKNLAKFFMHRPETSARDAATLQNFVNNSQQMMPESEARHLQNLLRLCQQNVPVTVQQAAVQQNLPDLPRLWAFMQMCELARLTNQMNSKAFKRAGKDVAEFTNSMRQAMGGENSAVQNQRSFQMMLPLYIGGNDHSYPTYLSVYDENEKDKDTGENKKETWVRICVLTDNIGAVELTFRVYEETQLDMRFYFSQRDVARDFRSYMDDLRNSLRETSFNIGEIRIGSIGERMEAG